ncbi:MAG: hypothetical protein MK289_18580 [Trichodesmium sp. ALOHA_ZT_67]|nr:hypothetical protein [Trichodesmium sp. ALOHA_ZT_67]
MDVIVEKKGPVSDIKILRKQPDKFDKKQKFQGYKADEGVERNTTLKKKPIKKEMPPEIE